MAIFGNTLYYPGCLTRQKLRHIGENYEKILKRAGISFKTIRDIELCCGMPALYAGYREDFRDIWERNKEIFENQKITKIITNCPACMRIFSNEYGIRTEHVTQVIARNLEKIKKDFGGEKVSYHDPCDLGRKSLVYEEPREILRHVRFEIVEMKSIRENALCCGAGGLLKMTSPRTANRIAANRLMEAGAKKVITTCPMCYLNLKENAKDIEVLELSEVLI